MPFSGRVLYFAPGLTIAIATARCRGPRKLIWESSSGGACLKSPMITPVTTLESIISASAMGGILAVNGTKFTFTPFNFPDEPVRVKKLLEACGSVPALSMTAVTLRLRVGPVDQGVARHAIGLIELCATGRRGLIDRWEVGGPLRRPEALEQVFQGRQVHHPDR